MLYDSMMESAPVAFPRNLSILVTSFTYRCFANWEPVFHRLRDQGHAVQTALFPRVSDPDHLKLLDLDFDNVALCRIGADFQTLDRSEEAVLSDLAGWIELVKPDLIWMCTVHEGPERHIRRRLSHLSDRPLTVGLQHGMHDDWPLYEAWADRFDVFATFGRHALDQFSNDFRQKTVVAGLPKLDDFPSRPRTGPIRRILFAGQSEPSIKELGLLLDALATDLGAEIVVRSHPEFRDTFAQLFTRFAVNSPDDPLAHVLASVDAMITTGSTVALEGLAAGLRVAVLPFQHGDVYQSAGIVARSLDPLDVLAVFKRYDDVAFRRGILQFLEDATGSGDGDRTDITIAAIGDLVRRRKELIERGLRSELAELGGKITALEQALSERTSALNGLRNELSGRDAMLAALFASTSWRITSPLRSAKRSFGKLGYSALGYPLKLGRQVLGICSLAPLRDWRAARIIASGSNNIKALLDREGSDKGRWYGGVYQVLLQPHRQSIRRVIEIGIGTLIPDAPSSMASDATEHYRPGGSLRAWREFLPNAEIHGVDVAPDTQFTDEPRIHTHLCDLTDAKQVADLFDRIGSPLPELIIDDGLHTYDAQISTLKNFWPYLASGGLYVLEDILPENLSRIWDGVPAVCPDGSFFVVDNKPEPERAPDAILIVVRKI